MEGVLEAGKLSGFKMTSDSDNIEMAIAMTGQLDYCDNKLTELIGRISHNYTIGETERIIKDKIGNAGTIVYVLKVQNPNDMLINYVLELVTKKTGIPISTLRNCKIKLRKVVEARDIAAFILRYRYNMGFTKIARVLGAKCHVTIVQACRKFDCRNIEKIQHAEGDALFVNAKKRYNR